MKIELNNITKSFKKNKVLKDITISFKKGYIYGLNGRNGSGKSVLIKTICGFYKPDSGTVTFNGKNYNESNEYPSNLRALIDKPTFFSDLSGFENLKLLALIKNEISEKEILKSLDIVNLTSEKDKRFSEYSLGMKQKLGIAQAIMEDPEIIILDEPFNGIEEETVRKLIKYFKNIKEKKIIIVSSHIKEDLIELADKIYYMDDGHVKE